MGPYKSPLCHINAEKNLNSERKHKTIRSKNLNEILAGSETEARWDQGGGFKHY